MQRYVASLAKRTAESYINLSQTTVLKVLTGGKVKATPLKKGYTDIIDQAVTNASMGVQNYQSAMRDSLRALSEGGLSAVQYESGVIRRLDTAVRMNLLEGVRQVNQGVQDQIGEEIGADGVEISAHGFCAPDHEDIQGKQMSHREYAAWTAAHTYPRRKIGVLNCHHFAFQIILGVNEPAYSESDLARLKAENAEGVTFEGKHYTMYEATQVQRKLETAARREKDKQILAKAAGDDVLRREAQSRINLITSKYKKFSDAAGLSYKSQRMSVSGFRKVKTAEELTKANGGGIINKNRLVLGIQFFAKIPKEKFTDYCLDPIRQPDKAIAFKDALGYTKENCAKLIENIEKHIDESKFIEKGDSGFGMKYEQIISIIGENGKEANVLTAWIDDNGEKRMTSVYVTKRKVTQ